MSKVETSRQLLVMAVQDLFDGEEQMANRLPVVRDNASDPDLSEIIGDDQRRSESQRNRLLAIAHRLGCPPRSTPNVWIAAILDDSDHDAESIERGRLLDIALVGALRKAKQSARVSYETALALAQELHLDETSATLEEIRDDEQACDDALARLLGRLCAADAIA